MLCILWCVEELHCVGDTSSSDIIIVDISTTDVSGEHRRPYQPFVVLALPAYLVIIMISDDMHYTLGVKDAQPSVVVVIVLL